MVRTLIAVLVGISAVIAPLSVTAQQAGERHSGTVVAVDPATRSVVLDELIENGRPRRLTVRVPDGAPVIVSERVAENQVSGLDAVFVDRAVDLRDVRPGDFVVAEGPVHGNAMTAGLVVVTLRGQAEGVAPAASPGPRSRP